LIEFLVDFVVFLELVLSVVFVLMLAVLVVAVLAVLEAVFLAWPTCFFELLLGLSFSLAASNRFALDTSLRCFLLAEAAVLVVGAFSLFDSSFSD